MQIRTTALSNHRGGPLDPDPAGSVRDRARRAEASGFNIASYADLVAGDPFPPLMLAAQATSTVGLMTRLVGAFGRSPVHLASASAWVDRVSGGRFALGLGASLRRATRNRLGFDFDRPVERMRDVIAIIRGLHAHGTFEHRGNVIDLPAGAIDIQPMGQVPIYLAAAGPRMLRLAGEIADGILLELTTEQNVAWAMARVREGAARVGRTLENFEVCVQATLLPPDDSPLPVTKRAVHLAFFARHCVDAEFVAMWENAGLADAPAQIAAAMAAGDTAAAYRLVERDLFPPMAIDCADDASAWRWLHGQAAAGATLFALPLEFDAMTGIPVPMIAARLSGSQRQTLLR